MGKLRHNLVKILVHGQSVSNGFELRKVPEGAFLSTICLTHLCSERTIQKYYQYIKQSHINPEDGGFFIIIILATELPSEKKQGPNQKALKKISL